MHGHHGIKQCCLRYTVCLQTQLEIMSIRIKSPGPPGLSQDKAMFIRAKQHLLAQAALIIFVVDGKSIVSNRFNLDYTDYLVALYTFDLGVFFYFL
jgi:hypothetical protein